MLASHYACLPASGAANCTDFIMAPSESEREAAFVELLDAAEVGSWMVLVEVSRFPHKRVEYVYTGVHASAEPVRGSHEAGAMSIFRSVHDDCDVQSFLSFNGVMFIAGHVQHRSSTIRTPWAAGTSAL